MKSRSRSGVYTLDMKHWKEQTKFLDRICDSQRGTHNYILVNSVRSPSPCGREICVIGALQETRISSTETQKTTFRIESLAVESVLKSSTHANNVLKFLEAVEYLIKVDDYFGTPNKFGQLV